jgi:hypothetical protein
MVRAVFSRDKQDAVLESLRQDTLRLISVTPVRMSLEEYFIKQLGERAEEKGSSGHSDNSDGGIRTDATLNRPYTSAGKP